MVNLFRGCPKIAFIGAIAIGEITGEHCRSSAAAWRPKIASGDAQILLG